MAEVIQYKTKIDRLGRQGYAAFAQAKSANSILKVYLVLGIAYIYFCSSNYMPLDYNG